MEFRSDLEFSISQYSKNSHGLLTLGETKVITLANGKKIELLPYLVDYHVTRGVSKEDPRIRRHPFVAIPDLAKSYIEHYNNAGIGEHWSEEDAIKMMRWQYGESLGDLFFVKWARDVETGKEFPVGFFCAYAKPYQGGNILWDGELFVKEEYRNLGIGKELVEAMFMMAKEKGINLFEALTYGDETGHPLKMWEKFGANATDLVHIEGNIDTMLNSIKKTEGKKTR